MALWHPKDIRQSKIIISPLNWGLGHATRLTLLVKQLLANDNHILLTGSSPSIDILAEEFPNLEIKKWQEAPYCFDKKFFSISSLISFHKQLNTQIKKDKKRATQLSKTFKADYIISDNRYGFYSDTTKNILITHQTCIKTPWGLIADNIVCKFMHKYLSPFDAIWLPDDKSVKLAGYLAWKKRKPNIIDIGFLSYACNQNKQEEKKEWDVMILLSGPEPSRSMIEKKIIQQIDAINGKKLMVAGKKYGANFGIKGLEYISYLSYKEVIKQMNRSKLVICSSGYSTIMDLYCIGVPAILIPTPRQTEQLYLAKYLSKRFPQQFVSLEIKHITYLPEIANIIIEGKDK